MNPAISSHRADLLQRLRPLIRTATRLHLQAPARPPAGPELRSYTGGHPYFEAGETWPHSAAGTPLSFLLQLFNTGDISLPPEIRLIQFFYDWEAFPWDTPDDGWQVRIYTRLQPERGILLEPPAGIPQTPCCEIHIEPILSLPDWESLEFYDAAAYEISPTADHEAPWEFYHSTAAQLSVESVHFSQVGGHPYWLQGWDPPRDATGKPLPLLFQLDSEPHAGFL